MTVVILGSKPNPVIPNDCDAVVYANGSIAYQSQLKSRSIVQHHVLSNSLLTDKNPLCTATRALLRGRRVDRAVIIQFRRDDEVAYTLDGLGYEYGELSVLSRRDKERITADAFPGNFLYAAVTSGYPARMKLLAVRHYLAKREIHVSTGVFCLLYALAGHVGNGPFVMCGIGMDPSGGYAHTGISAPRGHVLNDAVVLRRLAMSPFASDILSTDSSLSSATGIRAYGE